MASSFNSDNGGSDPGAFVRIVRASKSFGSTKVLDNVDLNVAHGNVSCIIGPSGAGKSTLLRCINFLERLDGGRIYVAGEPIGLREDGDRLYELSDRKAAWQRAKMGMVFQRFNLFPHMTVLENIAEAPIRVLKHDRKEVLERSRGLLASVGLAEKEKAYPIQLSGGQQQRVAIARALALEPELMLFDEPTSALDPELVGEVLDVMRQLAHRGITMIVVTHEMGFARDIADEVVFMAGGRIVEQGPPREVLRNPTELRTQQFLSSVLNGTHSDIPSVS